MRRRYIHSFRSLFLDPEGEEAAIQEVMGNLPKKAARRMSRLGIMLHHLLDGVEIGLDTTFVYGTSYSENGALQTFLDSMPFASPIAFQTSIHPGGIEQALILRRTEVGAFFPLAGGRPLMMQMLKLACAAQPPDILLCGGEEKGGWLLDFGIAHPCSFAFLMRVNDDPTGACGELAWDQEAHPQADSLPDMEEAVRRFACGDTVEFSSKATGLLRIVPR